MANCIFTNEKPIRSLDCFEFVPDSKDKPTKLGEGSFANVRLVQEKKTGKYYALKTITLNPSKISKTNLYYLRTEIQIHKQLDHPHIIKFYDNIQEGLNVHLVLDYAQNGTLYHYIQKKKVLTPNEIFHFFYQTCLAVQYIHQNDIFHRDIKPENLLLDQDLNIKLCDFGWAARSIQEKRTTLCGTYEYMAPEVVLKRPYDFRIDIWSLGILLYELIHREAPYKGRNINEILHSLSKPAIRFCSSIEPELKDLIEKILKIDPNDRMSLSGILSHPWIKYHLSKQEHAHTPRANHIISSKQESCISPRDGQDFLANQSQIPKNKYIREKKEENHYFLEYEPEMIAKKDSSSNNSSTLYPLKLGPLVSRIEERNGLLSPHTTNDLRSPQNRSALENDFDFNHSNQAENNSFNKEQSHCSTNLPHKLGEKWAFETRKNSNDSGSRKVFQKDIMSPDFSSKLSSILGQLNATSNKKNGGILANVLGIKCQNQVEASKTQNSFNSNSLYGDNLSTQSGQNISKHPSQKENTFDNTYDLPNSSLDHFKVKYDSENCKPISRAQTNNSNYRFDNNQLRGDILQNSNSFPFKITFKGRFKPETVKGSFQKYFNFEKNYSLQNSNDLSLSRTGLNSTVDSTISSFSKNFRNEDKIIYEDLSRIQSDSSVLKKR